MAMEHCIALTGGTGFAGPTIARALLDSGCSVRALVRPGRQDRLPSGCEVVVGSLEDPASLATLVRGATAVVHAASTMGTMDKTTLQRVNVQGTQSLVRAAADADVSRFVLISSIAARRPADGPYSTSKQQQEEAVRAGAVPWVILQPPVIVGPGCQVELTVLGLTARLPLLPIVSSRALLHPIGVADLARVVVAAVERDGVLGRTYQLGGGESLAFPELARRILALHGRRALLIPLPVPVARRVARVAERLLPKPPLTVEAVCAVDAGTPVDLGPARSDLGFEPGSLAEALV